MKGNNAWLGWTLFALGAGGAALGPGYLVYCSWLSGEAAGEHGITVGQPAELELSPQMNPIRFNSVIRYQPRLASATLRFRTAYIATLQRGDRGLWTSEFGVTQARKSQSRETNRRPRPGTTVGTRARGTATSNSTIRVFSVNEPGRYEFLVTPSKPSDLHVESVTLQVRKDVMRANLPLVITGFATLGVAALTGVGLVIARIVRRG